MRRGSLGVSKAKRNPHAGRHSTMPDDHSFEHDPNDPIETSTRFIPWLIPLCGAVMIFLLAMVAVHFG
jgi:hypothetical protein